MGGAGSFGRHLVESLLETTQCHVVVCGRSVANAATYVATLDSPRVSTAALDRNTADAKAITDLNAFVVVDAAGPFQNQSLAFARAVLKAGCHYVDLADARDFVARFSELDELAKARNVLAVTGASSTPALSNAVIDDLTRGWSRVDDVEIAISPGNQGATFGLAVIRSILSYAGRPVRLFLNGRWTTAPGWGLGVRRSFGELGKRPLALVDTPDLDIVPQRLPSVRNAIFRAGLEVRIMHYGLWLLGLLVRARILKSLTPLAEALRDGATLFRRFGTDSGGMLVEVTGRYADGARLKSTWRLLAFSEDGPKIPTIPALCVIRALLEGKMRAKGAMPCVGVISLETLEREFKRYAIEIERDTDSLEREPLFQRVLTRFDEMPEAVRAVHSPDPASDVAGEVDVEGAANWVGGVIAWVFGFPRSGRTHRASVIIEREGDGEVWIRRFGDSEFRSHITAGKTHDKLVERFGAIAFDMNVGTDASGFQFVVTGARAFGMPLPRVLLPTTRAGGSVDDRGRYRFDVLIELPFIGRLVGYRGWLSPATAGKQKGEGAVISAPSP